MAKRTRTQILWDEIKQIAGDDVRAFLRGALEGIKDRVDGLKDQQDALATQVQTNTARGTEAVAHIQDLERIVPQIDARVTANATKAGQLETALGAKAPLAHTHARADVQGLQNILTQLDARLTALEAKVR